MNIKLKIYEHVDTGELWYDYTGCDYGCCSPNEIPVTKEPGKYPFLGTDYRKLKDTGRLTEALVPEWWGKA